MDLYGFIWIEIARNWGGVRFCEIDVRTVLLCDGRSVAILCNTWDLTSKYSNLSSKNGDVYHPNIRVLTV